MKIDLAAIQAYLKTNPTQGEINDILYAIGEYQKQVNHAEAVWKRQLPDKEWGDLSRRYQFRDIFKQLQLQRISVSYLRGISGYGTQYWRLRRGKEEGGLTWDREVQSWTLYSFPLVDPNGEDLPEFSHVNVSYQTFLPL